MNPELPPLTPMPEDLDQLLDAERGFPKVPSAVEARLWSALAPQVPVALPKPTGHGGLPHTSALAKVSAKWPLAVAFALGGAAGAGVHAALVQPVVRVIAAPVAQAPKPLPAPTPIPSVTPVPPPMAKPTATHLSKVARLPAPAPAAFPAADDPSLRSEQALLEMGRTALARGEDRAAYETMVEHEQRFPKGRLAEERDAIRIQALAGMGRLDAARLLAQSFRAAYPKSLLRPAVDHAVGDAK